MIKRLRHIAKRALEIIGHKPVSATISIVAPQRELAGKTALVTGGTSGIGHAIARSFVEAGAFVIITGRNEAKAREAAAAIGGPDRIIGIRFDISDISAIPQNVTKAINAAPSGQIDILVNNAGVIGGDIRTSDEQEFDRVMDTNLKATFFLSKQIADHMISRSIRGNILNIASSSSLRPAISAYTLSKWGIRALTLGLAKMLIPHGIVVNGIAPGATATKMLGKTDYSDISHSFSPIRRYALPEEIASMALVLCSDRGRTVVGDILYMTGGAGIIDNSDMDYTYPPPPLTIEISDNYPYGTEIYRRARRTDSRIAA